MRGADLQHATVRRKPKRDYQLSDEKVGHLVTDHETLTVACLYAALALVGPFVVSMLMRWAESDDAQRLATEIGYAIEGVVR
jgi:hypothetical protein